MKYHALFVIFEKSLKICNRRLLQIKGDALRVNKLVHDNETCMPSLFHVAFRHNMDLDTRKPDFVGCEQ